MFKYLFADGAGRWCTKDHVLKSLFWTYRYSNNYSSYKRKDLIWVSLRLTASAPLIVGSIKTRWAKVDFYFRLSTQAKTSTVVFLQRTIKSLCSDSMSLSQESYRFIYRLSSVLKSLAEIFPCKNFSRDFSITSRANLEIPLSLFKRSLRRLMSWMRKSTVLLFSPRQQNLWVHSGVGSFPSWWYKAIFCISGFLKP